MVDTDGCWRWLGARTWDGYGRVWHDRRSARAHRVTYALLVGPVPAGHVLDHLCRVRDCVNPTHLEPVTVRVNTLRGDGPTARRHRARCAS